MTLHEYDITVKQIINLDETGVRMVCSNIEHVVVPIQVKELYNSTPENRKVVSIIEKQLQIGENPLYLLS